MKTEDLIKALAADAAVEPPLAGRLMLGLGLAFAGCLAIVGTVLGFRDNLGAALINPVSGLRVVLAAALMILAVRAVLVLARPDGVARLWPLLLPALAAAAAVIWALIGTPPDGWPMAVTGKTWVVCLVAIPGLSILPVAVLLATLRRGATTSPTLAGAMAGLAGGALAATAYALHCTEDSPLFYVTWYGLGIALVTLTGAAIGARLLRW